MQLENSKSLDWLCLAEVVRVEKEAATDIRLNMKLFRACLNDQKKFCKDVEPGHMRVQVSSSTAQQRSRQAAAQAAQVAAQQLVQQAVQQTLPQAGQQ